MTRGGGSLEDLWSFNDEALAWDIFNCPIPSISAVGHEVDFTIADFVSDFRCETPSTAAELLTEGQNQLKNLLLNNKKALLSTMERKLNFLQRKTVQHSPSVIIREIWKLFSLYQKRMQRLDITNRLFELVKIHEKSQRLDDLQNSLELNMSSLVSTVKNNLEKLFEMLRLLDPNDILGRGYSYIKYQKKVVSNYEQFDRIEEKEPLKIIFKDGEGKVQKV